MSGTAQHRHGLAGPFAAPGGSALSIRRETASQTAGPYVHIGLAPQAAGFDIFENNFGNVLVEHADQGRAHPHRGPRLRRHRHGAEGRADRDLAGQRRRQVRAPGRPPAGQGDRPDFRGWGRTCTDFDTGVYTFDTIKPGGVEGRNGRLMAPHINAWIVARGINIGLNTRMYFSDEAEANAKDAVLNLIEWEQRRETLVAERQTQADDGSAVYRFDIRLQGEDETVFFDV